MPIDIRSACRADSYSVSGFLLQSGQGCYIPAYQREYRWDKTNVDRIFEDADRGLSQLPESPQTISFLGTIIAIHDTTCATVQPVYHNEMPSRVMTIIDGQQRLSTFILIFIALHDRIARLRKGLDRETNGEAVNWLKKELDKLSPMLQNCIILDNGAGEGLNQYYPRIIRSFVDVWSSRPEAACYKGSISSLIWKYIEHIKGGSTVRREFKVEQNSSDDGAFLSVNRVYKHIVSQLKQLGQPSDEQIDLVGQGVMEGFGDELLGYEIDSSVVERLKSRKSDRSDQQFRDAFCCLIFAYYCQRRMAFTVVTTKSEDDAFDMFEALNTTGEPLTAFETFVPRVIEDVGLGDYKGSFEHKQVKRVKSYLDQFIERTDKIQTATTNMLISFALADTGRKLGAKLNDQRRYLRQRFDDPEKPPEFKRSFVKRLGDVADFMADAWMKEDNAISEKWKIEDPTAKVAFEYLRKLKHIVTIAPLSRFYGNVLSADNKDVRQRAVADLEAAIKACAAFTAIWRGAFGFSNNIDAVYRSMMLHGDGTSALAADPRGRLSSIDINLLKKVLKDKLGQEGIDIDSRKKWSKHVIKCPIYSKSLETARFLIVVASHDAVPDDAELGLAIKGRQGIQSTLTPDAWREFADMTIEHVAPQSPSDKSWKREIYEDPATAHTIGNLTLLPKQQNIVLANYSWPKKRLGFGALAARTQKEFKAWRAQAKAQGHDLPGQGEGTLNKAEHLALLTPLSKRQDHWDAAFINARSKRLAKLAWATLHTWLDL